MSRDGKKTGGRQIGSCNKVTTELKEKLKTIIEGELETISETLETMTAKERLDVVCKLIPYVIPKAEIEPKDDEQTSGEIYVTTNISIYKRDEAEKITD